MSVDGLQADLLLLLHESGKSAGELARSLGELRSKHLPLATLYRHLQRLVDSSWIEIDESGGDPTAPGRPGRRYRITRDGTAALRRSLEEQNRRLRRAAARGLLES